MERKFFHNITNLASLVRDIPKKSRSSRARYVCERKITMSEMENITIDDLKVKVANKLADGKLTRRSFLALSGSVFLTQKWTLGKIDENLGQKPINERPNDWI